MELFNLAQNRKKKNESFIQFHAAILKTKL